MGDAMLQQIMEAEELHRCVLKVTVTDLWKVLSL